MDGIGQALDGLFRALVGPATVPWTVVLLLPLALLGAWKAVELVAWALDHVTVTVGAPPPAL